MDVSEDNRTVARYLASMLGGAPSVSQYWDDDHRSDVDIMITRDVPAPNLTTYATLGLSDHSIGLSVGEKPLGVELLMAASSDRATAANILATCAFNVINSKMQAAPGAVFPRVVELYEPAGEMTDILFVPPFPWELETLTFDAKKVAWLLAMPISERERVYAIEHGSAALEKMLEHETVDAFDLGRPSVI